LIKKAITDAQTDLRAYGLIEAEKWPELVPQLIEKTADPSPKVSFQACLSLGQYKTPAASEALAKALILHIQDKWYRMGILSSETGASFALIDVLQKEGFFAQMTPDKESFLKDFGHVVRTRNRSGEAQRLALLLGKK